MYKSRDSRRDFRASASMSNMGINGRGLAAASPAASGEDGKNKALPTPAGRSQSFNEAQSVMRREAIINRPLPSPPIERYSQVGTNLEIIDLV